MNNEMNNEIMGGELTVNLGLKIKGWIRLSRLPFHLVGIAPMFVGAFYAKTMNYPLDNSLLLFSCIAVVLTMLSTHMAGEFYDQKEDLLSRGYGKSNFAGGSQAIQDRLIEQNSVKRVSNFSAIGVILIGLFIFFYYGTGVWTLPLGAFGLFCGYFYSTPPLRMVRRGIGEILIALCYGYLPISVSFYLQTGAFHSDLLLISTPIAISIFMVIFINEFPDYQSDNETGKRNLVVRLGIKKSAYLYVTTGIMMLASLLSLIFVYGAGSMIWLALPCAISIVLISMTVTGMHKNFRTREAICGLTILLNLSTNIILIFSV